MRRSDDVLELREIDRPVIGDDEVPVRDPASNVASFHVPDGLTNLV